MKQFYLDSHPFFDCHAGDKVVVLINGESRGFYCPSSDFRLYVVVDSSKVENDDLPF